jgi:hypothetical protein
VSAVNNRQSACTNNVCMQRIGIEQVFEAVVASYQERKATRSGLAGEARGPERRNAAAVAGMEVSAAAL